MYDPFVDLEYMVYMLKYESGCGRHSGIAATKAADDVVGSLRCEDWTVYSVSENLGIIGFDCIGRLVFCAAVCDLEAVVKVMYDPFMDLKYKMYMMKYDSVYGRLSRIATTKEVDDKEFSVVSSAEIQIQILHEKDPESIPGGATGAGYIREPTNAFMESERAELHVKGSAKQSLPHP